MMNPNLILYRYLVTRNFCQVLKSPALILFALKSYQQIESSLLSEENPKQTLSSLQRMFSPDKHLLNNTRKVGTYIGIEEEEMPEFKKAYFDAIVFFLCDKVMMELLIHPDLPEEKVKELEALNQFILNELKDALRKEVLKNHAQTDFQFDNSLPVKYQEEVGLFQTQYFKLSYLETIYIYVLRFINFIASCLNQRNDKVQPSP